ncbi:hypothetical protein QL285_062603 [Trifolium repens]|nr:hypothetical protein QL285_062603 [Trifolium repens]
MLTPGEVTQILSPTHWHTRAPTATLNEFTTQKFPRVHIQNFQSHFFCLRDIAYSTRLTQSGDGYPPKRNTETLRASPKLAKLVNSNQHDSVYF